MDNLKLARGLEWASLAIAATEIFGQGKVERDLLGTDEYPALLPALGLREAVAGATILSQTSITPTLAAGLWARVVGDAMDLTLMSGAARQTRKPLNLSVSTAMVVAITSLDVLCATRVHQQLAASSGKFMPRRAKLNRSRTSSSFVDSSR